MKLSSSESLQANFLLAVKIVDSMKDDLGFFDKDVDQAARHSR